VRERKTGGKRFHSRAKGQPKEDRKESQSCKSFLFTEGVAGLRRKDEGVYEHWRAGAS